MAGTAQNTDEHIADHVEVAQRKVAFIELPVAKPFIDHPPHRILDPAHVGFGNRTDRRLATVCQHDQCCFLGLGLGTFITKIFFDDALAMLAFGRLLVEIRNKRSPVMLADYICNHFRQLILTTELQPVTNMRSDDHRR